MDTFKSFNRDLYSVNDGNFLDIALQLFHFQAENNPVYKNFIQHLRIDARSVTTLHDIPYLPISFFKNNVLKTGDWKPEVVFTSSGTTGQQTSTHAVRSIDFYRNHAVRCFEYFFGDLRQFHFLALLPSYLERRDSSLVAMIEYFIDKSHSRFSGFYLHNTEKLLEDAEKLRTDGKKTVVWGVTFALLDLAERYHPDLSHCMVFETGGMKGRRREITRTELHATLADSFFYRNHAVRCFEYFFGDLRQFHFLALLPSYLERRDSSLVAMIEYFIDKSHSRFSGFYLHNTEKLLEDAEKLRTDGKKTVVWGVTFALLDLAERYHPDLSHCMVFETGGMKGRRREITRTELHATLADSFGVKKIFSEYGMTELLSQAYSKGGNAFFCPPWMRIIARDMTDPMEKGLLNETAGINVIDFANVDSVAFIETEDIGKVFSDGSFEILGRFDNSDVRGCNLMVE